MSFAGAVHFGDFAITVSDTRLLTRFADGSRKCNDTYRKIAQVPNTNIIAIATGKGTFQNKNFEQLVSETKSTELIRVYCELSGHIETCLFGEETASLIVLEHKDRRTTGILCTMRSMSTESNVFNYGDSDIGKGAFIGQDWAKNLAMRTNFAEHRESEEDAMNAMRNFVRNLTEISPVVQGDGGSIGGNICTVLLRPGKEPKLRTLHVLG
jgi:hypothetical protein